MSSLGRKKLNIVSKIVIFKRVMLCTFKNKFGSELELKIYSHIIYTRDSQIFDVINIKTS